jgi:lysophospholipase L1-like esterase
MNDRSALIKCTGAGRPHRPIRSVLLGVLTLASTAWWQPPAYADDRSWVGTWAASPQPIWGHDFAFPTKIPEKAGDQTIRQIVRVSLDGSQVRILFSNEYGTTPLRIGAASVALAGDGPSIVPETLHKLTFGGQTATVLPPGAPVVSDPVDMDVGEAGRLAVSLYLPDETPLTTFHWDGKQTAYIGSGDITASSTFSPIDTTDARVLLSGVLVNTHNKGTVVVFGDSITDGNGASLNADARWPDYLARRLAAQRTSVLNAGISGARLLQDKMGVNAPARFTRDALAQPGVKAVMLLLGINDISWPGTAFARQQAEPSADSLISAYRQLIALAHSHNVRIVGATLTPFEGALSGTPLGDYYNADKDALRQEVNRWIRTSGAFDAIIDFDALLRDPAHPSRLAAKFDSGDHLHPGDRGNQAMAEGVDLDALLGKSIGQP